MTRPRAIAAAGFTLLAITLLRTAWLVDDAYITFRASDNFLNGFGPVWNVSERVQAFTHPLWMMVCTAAFAITGEFYFTAIALGALVTFAGVALLAFRLSTSQAGLLLCFAALLSSKAFIDFSTAGLENPLSHLLVIVFVWQWWEQPDGPRRLLRLTLLGALLTMNRIDLGLIASPAIAHTAWRMGLRASWRPLLVGVLPLVAWEGFATFYYGTPIPNTAYAKLTATTVPFAARLDRGLAYFQRTLIQDPVTIPLMAVAAITVARERARSDWPLVAGMALYLLYILRIGGDFMMGRYFSTPFIVAVALMTRARWIEQPPRHLAAPAAVLIVGLLSPWEPALLSGYGYAYVQNYLGRMPAGRLDELPYFVVRQIGDARRVTYEDMGLIKVLVRGNPNHEWRTDGLNLRAQGRQVVLRGGIGLVGFYAGPEVHIVDFHALSDPLLARLPGGTAAAAPGHYRRAIPDGYLESLASGRNEIANPNLFIYYGALREIIAGDLMSWHRIETIGAFLTGRYDVYLQRYLANPGERGSQSQ